MKTILITGGSGLIGQALSPLLQQKGYRVIHLSRQQNLQAPFPAYRWDIAKKYIDTDALAQADAIIHLAGAGIADKRWSAARKREIMDSRVQSTQLLVDALQQSKHRPSVFLAASAIGYYGDTGDKDITEESPVGNGFMADVCKQWEQAAEPLWQTLGIRTPILRIGIVLARQGGALAKMLPSYRFRMGAYFGNGQQFMPWIHLSDICQSIIFLLENQQATGVFNGTAPHPVSNYQLAKNIALALGKKSLIMPAPAFALRLVMGEMADMLLMGTKVLPSRLQRMGFSFQFPTIDVALKDLIG